MEVTATPKPAEGAVVQHGHARAIEEKIERLSPRHIAFMTEYLNNGYNRIDAYYKAGYKPKNRVNASQNASELLKNPRISLILSGNVEEAKLILKNASAQAAAKLVRVMDDENVFTKEGVKISAAKDILDRAGIVPPEQQKPEHTFNIQINIVEKKRDKTTRSP